MAGKAGPVATSWASGGPRHGGESGGPPEARAPGGEGSPAPADPKAPDDLLHLEDFNDENLLAALWARYERKNIYTWVGSVLVSVNPYRDVGVFREDVLQQYASSNPPQAPHLFATVQAALAAPGDKHALLITGESGAGKTEATRAVLSFLATRRACGTFTRDRLLRSTPVLEAFGNAHTRQNTNSSRFGKFIEVHLNAVGEVAGATLQPYMLEASRVAGNLPEGERTYHVFYLLRAALSVLASGGKLPAGQMWERLGASPEWRELARTASAGLQSSARLCDGPPEARCAKWFEVLVEGLIGSGLQLAQVMDCCRVAAAVALLVDADRRAENLAAAAALLRVKESALSTFLAKAELSVGGGGKEHLIRERSSVEAATLRASLAQELYSALFGWLTRVVGQGIAPRQDAKKPGSCQLGLLDLYGFEVFSINGFEQLLINYCNERLQQLFNRQVFAREAEEYVAEGMDADGRMMRLTSACQLPALALLEGEPGTNRSLGIFGIVNDRSRCSFEESVSDSGKVSCALAETVAKAYAGHPAFCGAGRGACRAFGVKHFAGEVIYEAAQFVRKNASSHRPDIVTFLRTNGCPFVREVFGTGGAELVDNGASSSGSGYTRQPRRKLFGKTIISSFQQELNELCAALEARQCRHVRCLRPNDSQSPLVFDDASMLRQCRYSGLLEATRIRRQGFAHRRPLEAFVARYAELLGSRQARRAVRASLLTHHDALAACEVICDVARCEGVGEDDMHIGNTKVFLRQPALELLERARQNLAATTMTSLVRGWAVRHRLLILTESAVSIQCFARQCVARARLRALRVEAEAAAAAAAAAEAARIEEERRLEKERLEREASEEAARAQMAARAAEEAAQRAARAEQERLAREAEEAAWAEQERLAQEAEEAARLQQDLLERDKQEGFMTEEEEEELRQQEPHQAAVSEEAAAAEQAALAEEAAARAQETAKAEEASREAERQRLALEQAAAEAARAAAEREAAEAARRRAEAERKAAEEAWVHRQAVQMLVNARAEAAQRLEREARQHQQESRALQQRGGRSQAAEATKPKAGADKVSALEKEKAKEKEKEKEKESAARGGTTSTLQRWFQSRPARRPSSESSGSRRTTDSLWDCFCDKEADASCSEHPRSLSSKREKVQKMRQWSAEEGAPDGKQASVRVRVAPPAAPVLRGVPTPARRGAPPPTYEAPSSASARRGQLAQGSKHSAPIVVKAPGCQTSEGSPLRDASREPAAGVASACSAALASAQPLGPTTSRCAPTPASKVASPGDDAAGPAAAKSSPDNNSKAPTAVHSGSTAISSALASVFTGTAGIGASWSSLSSTATAAVAASLAGVGASTASLTAGAAASAAGPRRARSPPPSLGGSYGAFAPTRRPAAGEPLVAAPRAEGWISDADLRVSRTTLRGEAQARSWSEQPNVRVSIVAGGVRSPPRGGTGGHASPQRPVVRVRSPVVYRSILRAVSFTPRSLYPASPPRAGGATSPQRPCGAFPKTVFVKTAPVAAAGSRCVRPSSAAQVPLVQSKPCYRQARSPTRTTHVVQVNTFSPGALPHEGSWVRVRSPLAPPVARLASPAPSFAALGTSTPGRGGGARAPVSGMSTPSAKPLPAAPWLLCAGQAAQPSSPPPGEKSWSQPPAPGVVRRCSSPGCPPPHLVFQPASAAAPAPAVAQPWQGGFYVGSAQDDPQS